MDKESQKKVKKFWDWAERFIQELKTDYYNGIDIRSKIFGTFIDSLLNESLEEELKALMVLPAIIERQKQKWCDEEISKFEPIEKKINEIHPQVIKFIGNMKGVISAKLLLTMDAEENCLEDQDYLIKLIRENPDIIDQLDYKNVTLVTSLEDDFFEIANYAYEDGKKHVALVLYAIIIEHKINFFLREVLEKKKFDHAEITSILRSNNIRDKVGWLFKISTNEELPKDLKNDIIDIFELRNALVHYKPIPCPYFDDLSDDYWVKIKERVDEYSVNKLKNILNYIENHTDHYREANFKGYKQMINIRNKVMEDWKELIKTWMPEQ